MGSYRIEESPNKRAGCSVKACKDHKIKIQKGELRLGTWVDNERFQSWSYRHWGCVTVRVLANILEAIEENGEPNFDVLDGFEDLSAENQTKIKEAILKGDIDEADKTDDAQNEASGSPKKAKADAKAKSKKRSRAQSDDEEEVPSKKTKKTKGGATVKEEPTEEKPLRSNRARKAIKEESPGEEELPIKPTKKAKGKTTVKEETDEEKPAKRSRARKTNEETAQSGKPAKKSKKTAATVDDQSDEEEVDVKEEIETEVQLPAKKARGKVAAASGEKPKRGRKKKVADDEE
uniref:PARP-type zinc finger-containing protein C13F5.07c n=1 Tax=Talaromyces marneffei PM1 TaxID=1077442 RepID=A0A093XZF1_TALMA